MALQRETLFYRQTIDALLPTIQGGRKRLPFFVDPAASGSSHGLDHYQPVKTLQEAIDLCEDNVGDTIYVRSGSHGVTTPVLFNKKGIIVKALTLGYEPSVRGERCTVSAASTFTDDYVAKIYQPCWIFGLGFAGRDLTKGSLLIDCQESGGFDGGFSWLYQCRFSAWYGAIDAGIRTIGGDSNRIEECTFSGLFGGVGTAGIVMENDTGGLAPANTRVLNNFFEGLGSTKYCIKFATGAVPVGLLIAGNYSLPGFVNGSEAKLIDNNSVVSAGHVVRNHLAAFANKAASWANTTNSVMKWAGNYYAE